MKKHSRILNKIFIFILAAAFTGCGKESHRTDYVARVNNSYLTEKDLDRIITSTPGKNFYKNEIIRNWINREVLFQKALDEGIVNDDEYKRIIEDSKKELAASMLLEKYYSSEEITAEEEELNEFYNLHKDEFRLNEDHYLLNKARFRNEDYAVSFRNMVIESNWEGAVDDFSERFTIDEKRSSIFISESELHPVAVLRVVKELYPGEISIVINESSEEFIIIQMLQKYADGTIPPQAVIKEIIKRRLLKKKKDELVKNYIKDLYSDFEIEIRQE